MFQIFYFKRSGNKRREREESLCLNYIFPNWKEVQRRKMKGKEKKVEHFLFYSLVKYVIVSKNKTIYRLVIYSHYLMIHFKMNRIRV